ncbi:unnamed protein product [Darwinula stevensoni]|uniref:Uncharacterized protein n=1 Tax=Darwinula stevensoni TaxID=69355 RepID=A0A7R8X693_9CRUS|nr:unnamed protein product [Darwinula stevensoni]CAG0885518.1 unnamed protein product [Darwinula stevensoni]
MYRFHIMARRKDPSWRRTVAWELSRPLEGPSLSDVNGIFQSMDEVRQRLSETEKKLRMASKNWKKFPLISSSPFESSAAMFHSDQYHEASLPNSCNAHLEVNYRCLEVDHSTTSELSETEKKLRMASKNWKKFPLISSSPFESSAAMFHSDQYHEDSDAILGSFWADARIRPLLRVSVNLTPRNREANKG